MTDFEDARARLMQAAKDYHEGNRKITRHRLEGRITAEEAADRRAFLVTRQALAAEDYRRERGR